MPPNATILQKGADPEVDSYSAFFDNTGTGAGDTGLAALLRGTVTEVSGGGGTFSRVRGTVTEVCVGGTFAESGAHR